jgi:hypothetical protein
MAATRPDDAEKYPRTIGAAVELVLSRMSGDMRAWLRRFKGDEIELQVELAAGLTPGMSVRAMLGLWGENPELLAQVPPGYRHPDDASCYFLVECWRRLRTEARPAEPGPAADRAGTGRLPGV